MKRITFYLALFLTFTVKAQVARKVIVEHFTNTKCSICASRNPGLIDNLNAHPKVLHISIHPSSPYTGCFLSQQNTVDNDARTNFYGVYGSTPRLIINGSVVSGSFTDTALFTKYMGVTPFSITIKQFNIGLDSIASQIVIRRVAVGAPSGNASLFAGLVEDTLFRNGGNGENMHFNVLRKSLFTSQGKQVTLPQNVGDSIKITTTEKYSDFWNRSRMATVAILQDLTTKQVIQSELTNSNKNGTVLDLKIVNKGGIHIYPNPASTFVTLENLDNAVYTYQIMSANGILVKSANTISNTIDFGEFPNGTYFLKVFNTDFNVSHKLIIIH